MITPLLWALLFQQGSMRPLEELMRADPSKVRFVQDRPQSTVELQQQRLFVERFQKIIDALQRFADEYNKSRGYVWPLKEAKALRRAYRSLEQAMPVEKKPRGFPGPSADPADARRISSEDGPHLQAD